MAARHVGGAGSGPANFAGGGSSGAAPSGGSTGGGSAARALGLGGNSGGAPGFAPRGMSPTGRPVAPQAPTVGGAKPKRLRDMSEEEIALLTPEQLLYLQSAELYDL
jgi:hypothetical protein